MRLVWVLAILAACGDNLESLPSGESHIYRLSTPMESNQAFDILFVIDDSAAMAPFAAKLADNEVELLHALTPAFGPDLHLGVIASDPTNAGKLHEATAVPASFLTTTLQFDFSVQTNVDGALDDAFVALADVGANGGSRTEPLAMALTALARGTNPGFRRDGAHLGIIFITAGDDDSPGTPTDYANALREIATDPSDIEVSIAAGPCSTGSLSASDAPRLTAFAAQFPNRATQLEVCNDSLADLVRDELELRKFPLAAQCIDSPIVMPPVCSFWLQDSVTSEQRIIDPCPASAIPCWSIVPAPQCAASLHLAPALTPGVLTKPDVVENIECIAE